MSTAMISASLCVCVLRSELSDIKNPDLFDVQEQLILFLFTGK